MDLKKYVPLIILLGISGCTTTARMTREELSNMKIDCTQKQQQLDFLRSQSVTGDEYLINGLMISSTIGYINSVADGTYQQRRDFLDGYNGGIRLKIDQIKSVCHAYPPY